MSNDVESLRFLIVEDDPDYAAFLKVMSETCFAGAKAEIVSTAPDAIARLAAEEFDICILDYLLEESTGLEVLEEVDTASMLTAFIILTAHERRDIALHALRLGALDYLGKDGLDRFAFERSITYSLYRRRKEMELIRIALRDPLTGLGNRTLFDEQAQLLAEQTRREGTKFAIIYIDIDGFKPVNDRYGHQVGDEVLKHVANRIVERMRGCDVVARLGGDEFVITLSQLKEARSAQIVAEELAKTLSEPFRIGDYPIQVGASYGVAVFPDDTDQIDKLIALADERMYASKSTAELARSVAN
ncbi:MAG: GGDEF domain-containing response regulator [Rhodospirillales bacterium]|nr:GGDEF domain-containing response regulator [Rhodospirillales bacterium]